MIRAGGMATAVLQHASPFLSCTIAATPGLVTRDLSTAVAAALTTAGALVLPYTPLPPTASAAVINSQAPAQMAQALSANRAERAKLEEQLALLNQAAAAQTAQKLSKNRTEGAKLEEQLAFSPSRKIGL
ncbi:MAG: hypothetical protein ABSF62_11965 [Bryobacteraceae bacterium]|jgi:hypothetical protein